MTKVYIVRHGLTHHNVWTANAFKEKENGTMTEEFFAHPDGTKGDVSLTEEGHAQAKETAKELVGISFDAIYCSPYKRTRQTLDGLSEGLGATAPEPIFDDRIREYTMGDLDNMHPLKREQEGIFFDHNKISLACAYDYRQWNGESWEHDVAPRVQSFIDEIKQKHLNQTVLLVSHGGVIRTFYKLLLQEKSPTISKFIRLPNCSIHEFNL